MSIESSGVMVQSRRLVLEFLGFGGSTAADQASRVATNLVAAAHLGPLVWGTWYILNLVVRYGALTHLGTLNGLNREYPAELGRSRPDEAERLRQTALGVLLFTLGLAVAVAIIGLITLTSFRISTVLLTAGLLVIQQVFQYGAVSLKVEARFGTLSRLQFASAILQPALVLPLLYLNGLNGLILGRAVSLGVLVVVLLVSNRHFARTNLNVPRARRLVRIGFPIMVVGMLFTLFTTVDRWVIMGYLDAKELGYYSLTIMALGAVSLVPMVLAQQFYPRMSRAWGEKQDWTLMRQLAHRQSWLAFSLTAPIVIVGWISAAPIIHAFLPEYVSGIRPLTVALAAPLFLTVGHGYANVLNVTDHQYRYMSAIVAALVVNAIASVMLVNRMGLAGVAGGTLIGYLTFCIGVFLIGRATITNGIRS